MVLWVILWLEWYTSPTWRVLNFHTSLPWQCSEHNTSIASLATINYNRNWIGRKREREKNKNESNWPFTKIYLFRSQGNYIKKRISCIGIFFSFKYLNSLDFPFQWCFGWTFCNDSFFLFVSFCLCLIFFLFFNCSLAL